jgi:hypothetical protein
MKSELDWQPTVFNSVSFILSNELAEKVLIQKY